MTHNNDNDSEGASASPKPHEGNTDEPHVLIVGAGPTGLTLACELARFKIPFRIIDESATASAESRAFGIQSRTMEIMGQLGLAEEFLSQAHRQVQVRTYQSGNPIATIKLSNAVFPASPYQGLHILPQSQTEMILLKHLRAEYQICVERRMRLVSYSSESLPLQDALHQNVILQNLATASTETAKFRYIVGCDGAHSTVRRLANLKFEGEDYEQEFMLADCEVENAMHPEDFQLSFSDAGLILTLPLPKPKNETKNGPENGPEKEAETIPDRKMRAQSETSTGRTFVRLMGTRRVDGKNSARSPRKTSRLVTNQSLDNDSESQDSIADNLEMLARSVFQKNIRVSNCTWSSRFHLHHRGVQQYRKGSIFVTGDAAHIHSPVGAQGMNTGIQDASNLAWKLAYVLKGWSDDSLLDSYHDERHAVGEKILATTDRVFSFMNSRNAFLRLIRDWTVPTAMRLAMRSEKIQRKIFGFMSQTRIRYHPSDVVKDECEKADSLYLNGPAAGARAPIFSALMPEMSPESKVPGADPRCLLIHFTDQSKRSLHHREAMKVLASGYLDQVRVYLLNPETDRDLYTTYGVSQTGVFLVRPDGHIGYRSCGDSPEPIARYLAALMGNVKREELTGGVASPTKSVPERIPTASLAPHDAV